MVILVVFFFLFFFLGMGSFVGSSGFLLGSSMVNSGVMIIIDWVIGGMFFIIENFLDDSLFENSSICLVELIEVLIEGFCYFDSEYCDDILEG